MSATISGVHSGEILTHVERDEQGEFIHVSAVMNNNTRPFHVEEEGDNGQWFSLPVVDGRIRLTPWLATLAYLTRRIRIVFHDAVEGI
jgi:hypothetical protein